MWAVYRASIIPTDEIIAVKSIKITYDDDGISSNTLR